MARKVLSPQGSGRRFMWAGVGILTAACGPQSPGGSEQQSGDRAQYQQLEHLLWQNRRDFLDTTYGSLSATGNRLFFLDYQNDEPVALHGYNKATGKRTDYTFALYIPIAFPTTGDANYRASEALVVTATKSGAAVRYSAYAVDAAESLVGSLTLPTDDRDNWPAFQVVGNTVYLVIHDSSGTVLNQWTPGTSNVAAPLFTLESATGQRSLDAVSYIWTGGNALAFSAAGKLWYLDLVTKQALGLMNTAPVDGNSSVDVRSDGVFYSTSAGLFFYDLTTHSPEKVSDLIKSSSYLLNRSYADIHDYAGGFTRYSHYLLYRGNGGIFSYDLGTNTILPILLNPDGSESTAGDITDTPLVYRWPTAVSGGTLYVTGLQSSILGPIYQVDLSKLLH